MSKNLEPDEIFVFECNRCGNCCRDEREIVLNPLDVFNLSRSFDLNTGAFIEKYCQCEHLPEYGGFPLLSLRTDSGACVFIKNNNCSVHEVRPACCRNYPVGTLFKKDGQMQHVIMAPAPDCTGFDSGPRYTVDSWWQAAGLNDMASGIELMRLATQAITCKLTDRELQELYKILCDFDVLIQNSEISQTQSTPSETTVIMEFLSKRLNHLSQSSPHRNLS